METLFNAYKHSTPTKIAKQIREYYDDLREHHNNCFIYFLTLLPSYNYVRFIQLYH